MELLLNLAWLLLALPAFWLWSKSSGESAGRKFTALQCLLALGCLLVLLFPVVSATDDLRAMRTEMEESQVSKRSLRQSSTDKASAWKSHNPPALISSATPFLTNDIVWLQFATPFLSIPAAPAIERAARAPPCSFLA